MAKTDWKPGNMVYPLPAVMVSVGGSPEEYNIITIAWTGTICSDPPMCYISVRKGRHSYELLKKHRAFVINLTTKDLAFATDWCGVRSGRRYNKFEEMKLTPGKATVINAPTIEEAPINIECEVTEVLPLGSHDMFMAKIVNVRAEEVLIDPETGAFSMKRAGLIAYAHGQYYELGKALGKFGFSVEKKKTRRKRQQRKSD